MPRYLPNELKIDGYGTVLINQSEIEFDTRPTSLGVDAKSSLARFSGGSPGVLRRFSGGSPVVLRWFSGGSPVVLQIFLKLIKIIKSPKVLRRFSRSSTKVI